MKEVGLGIAIADYGSGFELEVVELKRIRIPEAPDVLDLLTVQEEQDKACATTTAFTFAMAPSPV